jgi:hypothetical protein
MDHNTFEKNLLIEKLKKKNYAGKYGVSRLFSKTEKTSREMQVQVV